MVDVNTVRCPACRGSKTVAKLGGVMGECNTCTGTGKIKEIDKPVAVMPIVDATATSIIDLVSQVQPIQIDPLEISEGVAVGEPVSAIPLNPTIAPIAKGEPNPQVKLNPSRAIYKRKG